MGRIGEAVDDVCRALAISQELAYPVGELLAVADLSLAAHYVGDYDDAVRLARLAAQVTAGIPGSLARRCSHYLTVALIDAGDLADAGRAPQQRDDPGAHGQRPSWPGRPARRRHCDGVRVRHRRRADHATSGQHATPTSSGPGRRADPRGAGIKRRVNPRDHHGWRAYLLSPLRQVC